MQLFRHQFFDVAKKKGGNEAKTTKKRPKPVVLCTSDREFKSILHRLPARSHFITPHHFYHNHIALRLDFSLKCNKSSPNYYTFYLCSVISSFFFLPFPSWKFCNLQYENRVLDGGVRVNCCHCKKSSHLSLSFALSQHFDFANHCSTFIQKKRKRKQFITFYKIIWMKMCRAGKMVNCNKLTHLQMNLHTVFRYCCCRCHTRMCFWFWCIFKCFRRWRSVLHLPLTICICICFVCVRNKSCAIFL